MSLLLPDKHISVTESLIGQAASFYSCLPAASPVPAAWISCKTLFGQITFERFALMLDVLYALHLIELNGSVVVKLRSVNAP
jgi:hypothetical protein